MGDGQHLAAGLLLGIGHPLPQVAGIVAAQRLHGVGLDQAGLGAVLAEDDVAVQVVAAGVGGPLEADERREAPGSLASSAALIVSRQAER